MRTKMEKPLQIPAGTLEKITFNGRLLISRRRILHRTLDVLVLVPRKLEFFNNITNRMNVFGGTCSPKKFNKKLRSYPCSKVELLGSWNHWKRTLRIFVAQKIRFRHWRQAKTLSEPYKSGLALQIKTVRQCGMWIIRIFCELTKTRGNVMSGSKCSKSFWNMLRTLWKTFRKGAFCARKTLQKSDVACWNKWERLFSNLSLLLGKRNIVRI